MPNVYVEPRPKASKETDPIEYYVLIFEDNKPVDGNEYKTQQDAITAAKNQGYKHPLVARVRMTDTGKPDQWRSADS